MRKIIFIVVGVVLLAVVGGVVFLMSNLDSIVKNAIETVGTKVAGVKVSVGSVKISLTEGKGTIKRPDRRQPSGFKTPTAFSLGAITVAIDTGSISGNPIIIKEVSDCRAAGDLRDHRLGSNIDAIQHNVQAFTGGGAARSGSGQAGQGPAAKGDEGEEEAGDRP